MISKGFKIHNEFGFQDRFFFFYASTLNILIVLLIKTREDAIKRRILGVALPSGLAIILTIVNLF